MLPLIRNDDISIDTTLDEMTIFCGLCDKYNLPIIQCITPLGHNIDIECDWDNEAIRKYAGEVSFENNDAVYKFLLNRHDFIATHGLFHTHKPTMLEQINANDLLRAMGFTPHYAVLPFNEESSEYSGAVYGMQVLGKCQRLEDFLEGMPMFGQKLTESILYCHSWRFKEGNKFGYSWERLDKCLQTISTM